MIRLDAGVSAMEDLEGLYFGCKSEDACAYRIRVEYERNLDDCARQNLPVLRWLDWRARLVAGWQTRDLVCLLEWTGFVLPGLAGGVAVEGEFVGRLALVLLIY